MTESFDLQVILTSGVADIERATLGLALALTNASSGDAVVVFLTMHGASWAAAVPPDAPEVMGFQSPSYYIGLLGEAGARIEACSSCVEHFCVSPRGPDGLRKLLDGVVYAGLSTAGARLASIPTVVF